jgi:hypothetical protein
MSLIDRFFQIISKPGMPSMGIVEKRAVTINVSLDALVKNVSDSARVECGRKLGAVRVLKAMHRPEDLFNAVEHNAIARFFARMICGETTVIGRMPVLRCNDELKTPLHFICQRNDFITVRHRQRAARQKIILKINNDQRVHREVYVPCDGLVRLSPFVKGED